MAVDREKLCADYMDGMSMQELMRKYCIGSEYVSHILYDAGFSGLKNIREPVASIVRPVKKAATWPCLSLTKKEWPGCCHHDRCANGAWCGAIRK